MGKLSDFVVSNHVPADWSCPSTSLISSVGISKSPKQNETGKLIHKASVCNDRKTSFGFWQKGKIRFFSMQLNQNLFSVWHYGFPQSLWHLTCLDISAITLLLYSYKCFVPFAVVNVT